MESRLDEDSEELQEARVYLDRLVIDTNRGVIARLDWNSQDNGSYTVVSLDPRNNPMEMPVPRIRRGSTWRRRGPDLEHKNILAPDVPDTVSQFMELTGYRNYDLMRHFTIDLNRDLKVWEVAQVLLVNDQTGFDTWGQALSITIPPGQIIPPPRSDYQQPNPALDAKRAEIRDEILKESISINSLLIELTFIINTLRHP